MATISLPLYNDVQFEAPFSQSPQDCSHTQFPAQIMDPVTENRYSKQIEWGVTTLARINWSYLHPSSELLPHCDQNDKALKYARQPVVVTAFIMNLLHDRPKAPPQIPNSINDAHNRRTLYLKWCSLWEAASGDILSAWRLYYHRQIQGRHIITEKLRGLISKRIRLDQLLARDILRWKVVMEELLVDIQRGYRQAVDVTSGPKSNPRITKGGKIQKPAKGAEGGGKRFWSDSVARKAMEDAAPYQGSYWPDWAFKDDEQNVELDEAPLSEKPDSTLR